MNNNESTPPAPPTTPATGGLRRRDLIVGALGALGGASVSVMNRGPRVWAGDTVIPGDVKLSYAQFADDLVALNLLNAVKAGRVTYLDIGAFDPIHDNNTYLFYLDGCRGVLVEPNVALSDKLRSVRPGDKLLVAGIGTDDATEADYYVFDNPGLNTFDKEQAEMVARETSRKLQKVVKMPMMNINRVIAGNFDGKAPDFISIDIEGLDYAVLKTLDFKKYRPKLICAETIITNTLRHNPETTKLMTDNGYEVRGMTVSNTLYLDKRLLPA